MQVAGRPYSEPLSIATETMLSPIWRFQSSGIPAVPLRIPKIEPRVAPVQSVSSPQLIAYLYFYMPFSLTKDAQG